VACEAGVSWCGGGKKEDEAGRPRKNVAHDISPRAETAVMRRTFRLIQLSFLDFRLLNCYRVQTGQLSRRLK
jgi:hypothetical protein